MSRPRLTRPLRRVAVLGASLVTIAAASLACVAVRDSSHDDGKGAATLTAAGVIGTPPAATTPYLPTRARVATFNLLGYGHTMPSGDNRLKVDGRTRQAQADQIIRANNLQIVGFQEMEQPQIDVFLSEMGAQYELWPGNTYTGASKVNVRGNSIAWRKDQWTAISTTYYDAPYFKGVNVPRPIVLLQNNASGQRVFVTNTHNPANTFGNASNYRTQNVAIQAGTFNALRKANPTTPIIFTGDMNDRSDFFCSFTKATAMRAVNGGTRTATTCTLPKSPQIDWIMSTTDVQWNGYQAVRTPYVKQTTDHPVVWADATFKAPQAARAGITHTVVIDVEGLPSAAISGVRQSWAPHLTAIRRSGASTLNARTPVEPKASIPNALSLLSGRPVTTGVGGHGFVWNRFNTKAAKFATVCKATGAYVNTVFDTVHNQGGSTSFMSTDPGAAIVLRSARSGLADSQGVDYGTNKLTVSSMQSNDAAAIKVLRKQIANAPRSISYLQLSSPRTVGEKYGYFGPKYAAAVRATDRRIAQVLNSIRASSRTATSTALIVTSSSGGSHKATVGTALPQYQIPLIVWGHGVPAGADLYAMNPSFTDPGVGRPGYAGSQPLRNANIANIVTTMLGYPTMPTPTTYGGAINLFQPANLIQRR
ncbi:alkaline phosphatase family protein [Nocardioides sp.]|uniref:alkaline phosphatase family protein n=1 Tax=Nocardioides sp. TaxID=35761 RepID=UPI002605F07D|nr:alkaline phosphatase family protein [Nocardioides sp.]